MKLTGESKAIAHCSVYLSKTHIVSQCPTSARKPEQCPVILHNQLKTMQDWPAKKYFEMILFNVLQLSCHRWNIYPYISYG